MSGLLWRPAVTLLTLLPTVIGLLNVSYPLPAPWSDPEACGSPSAPTPDLHNQTICDPDHQLSDHHRTMMTMLLAKCSREATMNTRVIVFLAADVTFLDDQKSDPKRSQVDRLLNTVVTSYNLTSQPPVLLVLAIRDQFNIASWQSPSLASVVTNEGRQEALNVAQDLHDLHKSFSASVSRYLFTICQKIHKEADKFTGEQILLTVIWIVFATVFILGVVGAVIYFVRLRRFSLKDRASDEDNTQSAPGRANSRPLSGDLTELHAVSYKSTGHVLLGVTDIRAVSVQNFTSTDNLLET